MRFGSVVKYRKKKGNWKENLYNKREKGEWKIKIKRIQNKGQGFE